MRFGSNLGDDFEARLGRLTLMSFIGIMLTVPAAQAQQTLRGHMHSLATAAADRGPVDPATRLPMLTLLFKRSTEQLASMERLQAAQQDPASPDYHRWLTPAEFADRFGMDAAAEARVVGWLESEGFHVEGMGKSRTWITFSGIAEQVNRAFRTPLRIYEVDGVRHFAPAADPVLPASVAPLVAGIRGLDDFRARPALVGSSGANYLAPDDLAVIYNIAPLYAAGFDGTGRSIAVVGESEPNLEDVRDYRRMFGLDLRDPQVIAVPKHYLVGQTGGSAQREAALDLEIAGAVARKADLIYVYAPSVEDAIRYVIDTSAAQVLSSSYLLCEKGVTPSLREDILRLAGDAAMKGITWVNASGDSGPAGCDAQAKPGTVAVKGLSVNFLAAPPEVTAVGGTTLNDSKPGFWAGGSFPAGGSALSYVDETAWNDSSAAAGLLASGGGISKLVNQPT